MKHLLIVILVVLAGICIVDGTCKPRVQSSTNESLTALAAANKELTQTNAWLVTQIEGLEDALNRSVQIPISLVDTMEDGDIVEITRYKSPALGGADFHIERSEEQLTIRVTEEKLMDTLAYFVYLVVHQGQ